MTEIHILSAARTAIGGFGGSLSALPPIDIATHVAKAALERAGVEGAQIGQVVMGHVINTEPRDMYLSPGPDAIATSWFNLPPALEHYYAPNHPGYRPLPPMLGDEAENVNMQMIDPANGSKLFAPVQLNGELGRIVLHAAHPVPGTTVHWDLDGNYLGSTVGDHRLAIAISDGEHRLTITDPEGASLETHFGVISARSEH